MLAPLLRYREAWEQDLRKKGQEPPAAGQRILDLLLEKQFATVADLKSELDDGLDQDTLDTAIAQLVNDCWVEVVR